MGLGSGVAMLCAQYYGKKDMKAINVVQGIAMRFSMGFCTAFALCAAIFPKQMMWVFTKNERLIELGADYLRVISISYFCWGIIEVYLSVLRQGLRFYFWQMSRSRKRDGRKQINIIRIFGQFWSI